MSYGIEFCVTIDYNFPVSWQTRQLEAGVFNNGMCSDSSNGTCIQAEVSDVIWLID